MKCVRALLLLYVFVSSITLGATYHVPSDYPTIQEGINAAVSGDTVEVADNTYTGTNNKNLSFSGKAITVISANGAENCVIDCENDGYGFAFNSSETQDSILDGFTITHGFQSGMNGGAVRINNASPTIQNCIINDNNGQNGGGIHCEGGNPKIIGCHILANTTTGSGGGAWFHSSRPEIVSCIFDSNQSAQYGAGIFLSNFSVFITGCNFTNNVVIGNYSGGGIHLITIELSTITNSVFTGNEAFTGGGVYSDGGGNRNTFFNCLIYGNTSRTGAGAGIYSYDYTQLLNCTIADNTGTGIYFAYDGCKARDTISWGNSSAALVGADQDVTFSCIQEGYYGIGNIDMDPMFITGPDGDYYLSKIASGQAANSPCNNRGSDYSAQICFLMADGFVCMNEMTTRTDQIKDNGLVNLGYHYERSSFATATPTPIGTIPTPTSTPIHTPQIISVPGDYNSIQVAIFYAFNGDTVRVADGTYTGTWNTNLDFLGKAIAVESENGPDTTVIDCENSGKGVIFQGLEGHDAILDGFTIINGDTSASRSANGGGIEIYQSSPTIRNCNITNCTAVDGGGLYCLEGSPIIYNCEIHDNQASDEGGGMWFEMSDISISKCRFESNASTNSGGGIHLKFSGATIMRCEFIGNASIGDNKGGGIYFHTNSRSELADCEFEYNIADFGSAIYSDCGSHRGYITNCVIHHGTTWDSGSAALVAEEYTIISNCTITGNSGGGVRFISGGGGMTDSISWGNTGNAVIGVENVTFCDIEGGYYGAGNIDQDPLFVTGPDGDYFLSHVGTGHPSNSPCINRGSDLSSAICFPTDLGTICMSELTTRTDGLKDTLLVNLGYHYRPGTVATATPTPTGTIPSPTETPAHTPQIIHVPGDSSTIQGAIYAAGDGDTVLVADGIYTGTGNKDIDFLGKAITVVSETGPNATIINCQGSGRGVIFQGDEGNDSVLDGFRIFNGNTTASRSEHGAGIEIYDSAPTIQNCIISNCTAYHGGGIYCYSGSPVITNCKMKNNAANGSGGGAYFINSHPEIIDCTFDANQSGSNGGGIFMGNYTALMSGCIFLNNQTTGLANGGGIYLSTNEDADITSCAFSENEAESGAAICSFGLSLNVRISNCLLVNNTARNSSGGTLFALDHTLVSNCTIADNSGYGLVSQVAADSSAIDTIIWGNTSSISGSPTVTVSNVQGGYAGNGNIDSNPLFVAGTWGDYYLDQTGLNPSVDSGSRSASEICFPGSNGEFCMDEVSTNINSVSDTGMVDMGFHYPAGATPTPTATPQLGILQGYVELDRSTPAPNASWIIDVEVTLCSAGENIAEYTTTSDENGFFSVETLSGVFDVRIKGTHTLANVVPGIVIPSGSTSSDVYSGDLLEGDANNDNVIISSDFFILRDAYNSALGDPNYDAGADFNQDDLVTSIDFFMLRDNYNVAGESCGI